MIEAITKRKSVRSFEDKKVEAEKVESVLRAAMRAPQRHQRPALGVCRGGRPGGAHRYAEAEPRRTDLADRTSGHRGAGKGDPFPH